MKALFLNFFKKLFLAFDLLFFSCFGKNAGKGIYFFACFVYTIGEEERKDMPAEYTHQLIAEQIYARLPEGLRQKISDLPSYFLGAQGGGCLLFCQLFQKAEHRQVSAQPLRVRGVRRPFARERRERPFLCGGVHRALCCRHCLSSLCICAGTVFYARLSPKECPLACLYRERS